ncbi:MAG: hypothetical protein ABH891_07830 [Candidatus Omnitrophota bacterium]
MKRFSVASLTEILSKSRLPIAVFSLVLMIVAASSILFCEKEIAAQGKKWRSLYALNEVWGYEDPKAMEEGQLRNLTRYDIEVSLTRSACRRAEIRFCDRCSFILSKYSSSSGVYCKDEQGREGYVSTIKYPLSPLCVIPGFKRSEGFQLRLKCDLIEKTVLVYVNGKFAEKIPLGPESLHDSFGLAIPPAGEEVILDKLKISDPKGRVLFHVNFPLLYFYKFISQVFLSLGVLIFLALACSERRFFRKVLLFVFPLVFIEIFLRVTYPHDPGLDIDRLKPKWRFEISTNFFGAFNDPKELTIRSYFGDRPNKYLIASPEHTTRILCAGSSPLMAGPPLFDQDFPALLEKKLNAWNQKKNIVIPIIIPWSDNFRNVEMNVYLREVLKKINPDLMLFYGTLSPFYEEYDKAQFEEDYALYQRAKRVMEKNSGWIKNDRLLYAALEFKEPVKEIVYLYDFLCKSYLFMAVENIRKRFLGAWHSGDRVTSIENPNFLFEALITLCKEKGIKVVFIPQLNFLTRSNHKLTENFLVNFRQKYPEIYYLSLEGIFKRYENFLIARDRAHANNYGNEVMAQEIFRQLTEN